MLDLLQTRRSIRKFQSQPLTDAEVDTLVEAILRAPSSRGRNPWEFIVVRDPETLLKLSSAKTHGSAFLANAPLAVVVAADPRRCDVWIEDCSIAAITLQYAAASLGLGSCWVQIRLREHDAETSSEAYVKRLVGLPESLVVDCIVAVGHPGEEKPGHPRAELPFDRVHRETFGQGWQGP